MGRKELLQLIACHKVDLDRLGVTSLLVFGSVARDEAGPNSDVDLIADFNRPIGFLGLGQVQREFERLLGCRVDLTTPGMIRSDLRDRIYGEAVRVV